MINGVIRVGPPLQPEQGKFNVDVLNGLDVVLSEMGKRNMKAVIFISNNWEWSGGFQQYLIWNGLVPDDQKTRKLTWDELRDIVSKFYAAHHARMLTSSIWRCSLTEQTPSQNVSMRTILRSWRGAR
jgi:mannan endo-1,4-beta-mannosidase